MGIKVTNNAYGTLAAGITTGDTVITLTSGDGVRFPALGAGDYFFGTLIDTGNNLEIVRVTARATDTLTVQRGQDGTTARAYSAGDRFELRPTAAMFQAFTQADGISYSNTVSGLAATNAQAAIDELDTIIDALGTGKQDILVSGSNIKTVNGLSLVGAGNITITSGGCSGQVFTSNGMFTVPAGVTKIKVTVVGGGGGGGGYSGDGGGAGGIAVKYITTTPGAQYSVTIGSGGGGGGLVGGGGSGGTSSFGAECSATGGSGGGGNRVNTTPPVATAGGVGTGGTYNIPGGRGKRGLSIYDSNIPSSVFYGQDGGDSLFGCGGLGTLSSYGVGGAAAGYGAGGGGGASGVGGAGAPGIVIVEW